MSIAEVEKEIENFIDKKTEEKIAINVPWIVQGVLMLWEKPNCKHEEQYLVCAEFAVRNLTTRIIRKEKVSGAHTTEQLALPGYEYLQKRYDIERNGDQYVVPIFSMTKEECKQKIKELRKMGAGCFFHADELERFMNEKFAAIAS